jgi:hypothetical protein
MCELHNRKISVSISFNCLKSNISIWVSVVNLLFCHWNHEIYIQEAGCWIQDCWQAEPGLDTTSFMREKYSSDRSNCGGDVKSPFSRGVVSRISQCFWQSNDLLGWSCCAMFLNNFCPLSKMLASKWSICVDASLYSFAVSNLQFSSFPWRLQSFSSE